MKPILLATVVSLGLLLALQWRNWPPERISEPEAGADPRSETASPAPSGSPMEMLPPPEEKEEYAVVIERPLFTPDRRPPSDEPEEQGLEPPPGGDTSLDRLDLNAVIITPAKAIAWVRDPTKKDLQDLELGDDLNGWTVKEILSDRMVLERQGETDTLTLRDYENMPPPVQRPPVQPRTVPAPRTPPSLGQMPPGARNAPRSPAVPNRPNAPPSRGAPNPLTRSDAQRTR